MLQDPGVRVLAILLKSHACDHPTASGFDQSRQFREDRPPWPPPLADRARTHKVDVGNMARHARRCREDPAAQTAGLCCLVRMLKGTDRHKEHGADSRTGHNMQKPHGLGNAQARQSSPHAGSLPSVSPVNPRVGFSLRLRASPAPLFFLSFQLLRKLGGPEKKKPRPARHINTVQRARHKHHITSHFLGVSPDHLHPPRLCRLAVFNTNQRNPTT